MAHKQWLSVKMHPAAAVGAYVATISATITMGNSSCNTERGRAGGAPGGDPPIQDAKVAAWWEENREGWERGQPRQGKSPSAFRVDAHREWRSGRSARCAANQAAGKTPT